MTHTEGKILRPRKTNAQIRDEGYEAGLLAGSASQARLTNEYMGELDAARFRAGVAVRVLAKAKKARRIERAIWAILAIALAVSPFIR